MKLICMRGYSGSGKSTRAAELAKEHDAVIVNRDQIRKMLLNDWWTGDKKDEDRVTVAEEAQVRALLKSGVSVVVDATHLHPGYLRKWARLGTRLGADFVVVDVDADESTCRQRDHARMKAGGRYVGDEVIAKQVKRFPRAKWPIIKADPPFVVEPVEVDESLPKAIIVDIDGTLAHTVGRSPYDYTRVSEDSVDLTIRELVNLCNTVGSQILLVSGRDNSCYNTTRQWLWDNSVWFDRLWMRPVEAVDSRGGKLPDFMIKYDIFNKHIRGKYNVQFVLDDRDQVVDLWRRLGLKCLQVAPGDF